MPGWKDAHKETGISPEEYFNKADEQGNPVDWMLSLYYKMAGSPGWPDCARFLENGYAIDGYASR